MIEPDPNPVSPAQQCQRMSQELHAMRGGVPAKLRCCVDAAIMLVEYIARRITESHTQKLRSATLEEPPRE